MTSTICYWKAENHVVTDAWLGTHQQSGQRRLAQALRTRDHQRLTHRPQHLNAAAPARR
jgi:hypothetical protein